MSENYDVIVIGSGHNGLACACYLAKAGLSVLILEQYSSIGGMTSTKELVLPHYKSDIHASGYQIGNLSPVAKELQLNTYGLKFLQPDPSCSVVFPNGKMISIARNLENTIKSINAFSKQDGMRWRMIFQEYLEQKQQIIDSLLTLPNKEEPLSQTVSAYKFETQTVRSWGHEQFESEALRCFISAFPLYVGLAPDDVGSAKSARLFACVMQDAGNNVVKGGMQELSNALSQYFIAHGGKIRLNAKVNRIHVQNNRAIGVSLSSGEDIGVSKVIVSNVHPVSLACDLLGENVLEKSVMARMKQFEYGESIMTLFVALNEPLIYKAGIQAAHSGNVLLAPSSVYELAKMANEARSGLLPAHPLIVIWNDSMNDTTRAPVGKHLIRINVFNVPYEIKGDALGKIQGTHWEDVKEAYADRIINLLTDFYTPNLKHIILKRLVHSPINIEEAMSTAMHGTICHGALVPYQKGWQRPVAEFSQYKTPIPNVYHCGAGTHPGPGVSMVSGRNAASTILDEQITKMTR